MDRSAPFLNIDFANGEVIELKAGSINKFSTLGNFHWAKTIDLK